MLYLQENTLLNNGEYRILGFLGQGGFGITYLAEEVSTCKKVAIKEFFFKSSSQRDAATGCVNVLEQSRSDAENLRVKFLKEGRLLMSFKNKHIVRVFDTFEDNNTSYYVMDYVEGVTLLNLMEKGPMPEHLALDYIKQVGEALSYIHSKKVMHLDIKPENIMLRNDGRIILIDFGISKHYDDSGKQTSIMQGAFTKSYAAPEQINCDVKVFTPATDIYSLGATLYSLLTSQKPKDSYAIKLHGLGVRPSHISRNVWNAIGMAMKYDVADRPETVSDFLSLLSTTMEDSDETVYINGKIMDDADETTVIGSQERYKKETIDEDERIRRENQEREKEIRKRREDEEKRRLEKEENLTRWRERKEREMKLQKKQTTKKVGTIWPLKTSIIVFVISAGYDALCVVTEFNVGNVILSIIAVVCFVVACIALFDIWDNLYQ